MANSQRLAKVRSAIEGYLASQEVEPKSGVGAGQSGVDCVISTQSILIRNEHYCGWRFNTATHRAVWFIEEDQVKIHSADDQLCCVMNADEIDAAAAASDETSPHIISIHSQSAEPAEVDADIVEDVRRAA